MSGLNDQASGIPSAELRKLEKTYRVVADAFGGPISFLSENYAEDAAHGVRIKTGLPVKIKLVASRTALAYNCEMYDRPDMDKSSKFNLKNHLPLTIALLVVLLLALRVSYPPVLGGLWEANALFQIMAPASLPLDMRIPPGGFVEYSYVVTDLARFLSEALGLSNASARLLPIIHGFLCVLLLFVVSRRMFGGLAAACAAGLLATNQTFYIFQHELLVIAISLALFIFVLERLQKLLTEPGTLSSLTFGLACALAAFPHALVRYYMLLALGSAILMLFLAKRFRQASFVLAGFFATLALLDPRNPAIVLDLSSFPAGPGSEGVESVGELLQVVPVNLKLWWGYLGGSTTELAKHSTDLIVLNGYRLFERELLPFLLIGVAWLCRRAKSDRAARSLLAILALTLFAPLASAVRYEEGIALPTISSYRMLYAIPPLCLCIALGFGATLRKFASFGGLRLQRIVALLPALLLVWGAISIELEAQRMRRYVSEYPCGFVTSKAGLHRFDCGRLSEDNPAELAVKTPQDLIEARRHPLYSEQIAFLKTAQLLKETIDGDDAATSSGAVTLLTVSERVSKPMMWNGRFSRKNYKGIFLAYYLGGMGIKPAYFRVFNASEVGEAGEQEPSWFAPSDVERVSPARYDADKGDYAASFTGQELRLQTSWNGASPLRPRYFLVTTKSEELAFERLARARGWAVKRIRAFGERPNL